MNPMMTRELAQYTNYLRTIQHHVCFRGKSKMMMPDEIKSGPLKAAYSMFDDSWTIYIDRGESRPGLLSPAPIKAVELCKQGARQTIFLNIKDKDQDVTLVTPFWINAGWEVNHEKVLEMAASVHTLQAVISETDKACKDCPHFLECKGL